MRIQTARRHDTATATSSTSAATATGCAPIRTYGEPPGHRRSRKPLPREPRDCHASGLKRRRPGAGLWSLRSRRPPQDPIKATERAQAGPRLPSPESAQFSVARNAQFSSAIDSWAGKPPPRLASRRRLQVHPRVGGETSRSRRSPHGVHPRVGGETIEKYVWPTSRRVHPRVGGETGQGGLHVALRHPRVGGETVNRPSARRVHPRVGGETSLARRQEVEPAQASARKQRVHPRVGGETGRAPSRRPSAAGSIPAWAGKP